MTLYGVGGTMKTDDITISGPFFGPFTTEHIEIVMSARYNFTPQDDMTPLESLYIALALQKSPWIPVYENGYWDKIKRHFTRVNP
jgi:hypothetical protein